MRALSCIYQVVTGAVLYDSSYRLCMFHVWQVPVESHKSNLRIEPITGVFVFVAKINFPKSRR